MLVDPVTEEVEGGLAQDAFAAINDHAVVVQNFENAFEVFQVLFRRFGCHQDIVYVHKRVRYVAQDFVHKTLEILSCVLESKWCAGEKKQAEWSDDACLFNIFVGDRYLMIPFEKVDFTEDLFPGELGVEVS